MARPRTPAKVLELRGAFEKNPQRAREDAPGAGPFEFDPPTHLPQDVVPAWRWITERLPKIVLTSSDEVAVETAARLLAEVWASRRPDTKVIGELRQWLGQLGMTPVARTKIPAHNPNASANPFAKLDD